MKRLKDILYKCSIVRVTGNNDIPIERITFDSRDITKGSAFVAINGTVTDGHKFIEQAVNAGASAVICENLPGHIDKDVCYILVKDSAETLAYMACNFYDNPSEKINLVGITGTNGKTTTATLLYDLYRIAGYKTGLISTVKNCIHNNEFPTKHTTPDPLQLNALLAEMVEFGCEYCFMEVSSHAVVQHRTTGLQFKVGVFSNLTHDHLDFHKTFDAYRDAKKTFFDKLPANATALVNIDDKNGRFMVQNTKAKVATMAIRKTADYHCKVLENQFDGLLLNINSKEIWTHLAGEFNAYNILAIYAVARILELAENDALVGISKLMPVDGRFQYFRSTSGIVAIVDYAHTPDALKNVIDTINDIRGGSGHLITVVGAGGDRDKSKRPVMARIAAEGSNMVILTSDNPRTEDPEVILNEMNTGIPIDKKKRSLIITDRKQAIKTAYTMANQGDIILIAGKGHETYQEIKGVRFHFDDREIIKEFFNNQ